MVLRFFRSAFGARSARAASEPSSIDDAVAISESADLSGTLHCASPQCAYPIVEGPVAYVEAQRALYHFFNPDGEACGQIGAARLVFASREPVYARFDEVSIGQAHRLAQTGAVDNRYDPPGQTVSTPSS